MHFQTFPSPRAWKRHTGRAHQVGLSAGALACLGTEPHAHEDPASFTGWIGTVKILGRDDADHRRPARRRSDRHRPRRCGEEPRPILLHPARAYLQASRRRARPRQARARHPQPRRRPTHRRLRRHHAPHRPRSREGKCHPAGGITMRYQVRYQTVDGQDEHFAEATTFLDAVLRPNRSTTIRRTERRPFILRSTSSTPRRKKN